MKEKINILKESNLFSYVGPHPNPDHPLIKNNPKMKGVWVADSLKTKYGECKNFLNENRIKHSPTNGKKSFFIWLE